MHQFVDGSALPRIGRVHLFDDMLIGIGVAERLREQQRVRGRSDRIIDAIELLPRSPFAERK